MENLKTSFCGISFKNPFIGASGCVGFGREYNEIIDIESFGGIAVKGLTLKPRLGNKATRVVETHGGMLNAVGLQNPGIESFLENDLPWLKTKDIVTIANIAGATEDEFIELAKILNNSDVDMIEVNISCPNVKEGGVAFGVDEKNVSKISNIVKNNAPNKIVVTKLSPNVTNIKKMAKAAENGGADAISLVNTFVGMKIDISTKKPVIYNNTGGYSGSSIFPIALNMVAQAAQEINIPIIGLGGICSADDALQMIIAGASLFEVGTALFTNPNIADVINSGISEYLSKNKIDNIKNLVKTITMNE